MFNGGIEGVYGNLSLGLLDAGFAVDLVLNQIGFEAGLERFDRRVRLQVIGGRGVGRLLRLMAYIERVQPTALIVAGHMDNEIALMARWMGKKIPHLMVTEHSCMFTEQANASLWQGRRWAPLLSRWLYPSADVCVGVSRGITAGLDSLTQGRAKTATVYNPVITPQLFELAQVTCPHPWLTDPALRTVVYVGRLSPPKDCPTMMTAFAKLKGDKRLRLLILGAGEQRDEIEQMVKALDLREQVQLLGFCENPYPYIARAATLLLSSRSEGLGNVLIEALALGTPVVSTDCDFGPREILDQGRWGHLIPVGDADAMAQAIQASVDQPRRTPDAEWFSRYQTQSVTRQYLDLLGL